MRKILVLENVDHSEQRFSQYLNQHHSTDEVELFYSVMNKKQVEVEEKLMTTGLTDLMMESTFTDVTQLILFASTLIKFKDKISFRKISVMYTYNELDVFLSSLCKRDKAAAEVLGKLFDIYSIYSIEYKEFREETSTRKYLEKLFFYYDVVKVEKYNFKNSEVGEFMFEYEKPSVIDPRKKFRRKILVPFDRSIINGLIAKDFFSEIKSMLKWQQEVINSDTGNPDHEKLKIENLGNQEFLELLKLSIKAEL